MASEELTDHEQRDSASDVKVSLDHLKGPTISVYGDNVIGNNLPRG